MRNLTITRNKSFVASLAKLKVYIEAPVGSELMIAGVPCRKLGDLKNGETKTFSIEENQARVFVIADTLSKDYCNEFYQLSAGAEDVTLSGKCHYNPGAGNPFCFDGNDNPEVLQNRKKNKKKGFWVIALAIVVGIVIGLLPSLGELDDNEPKVFKADGLEITLTGEYHSFNEDGFTGCFATAENVVLVIKEPLYTLEGLDITNLEEYAQAVLDYSFEEGYQLQTTEDGLLYVEYDYVDEEDSLNYFMVFYKSIDAYWQVTFSTDTENAQQMRPQFIEYAKSVTFS